MTLDDADDRISRLMAQNLILRDFLIWLLVRHIGESKDPDAVIRKADEFANYRASKLDTKTKEDLRVAEFLLLEKDLIISAVTKVLTELGKL